jgi:hypothetical protein
LSPTGSYALQISAALPIKARVILDSSLIAVRPDTDPADPYEIPLGDAARLSVISGQVEKLPPLVARGDGPAGAANIFAILIEGPRSRRALPQSQSPKSPFAGGSPRT